MPGAPPIRIGTSGWHYDHWRGRLYPPDLPKGEWLPFYAARFSTVEVNNSFYQLPSRETLVAWRESVPDGFVFAVKASRYITHMKKLKEPAAPLAKFLQRMEALEDKLGPVLFQLPPRWGFDRQRLASFVARLPGDHRFAFEFRDPSWFTAAAYRELEEKGAAFCIYDLGGLMSPKEVTADFVYVRLHGPAAEYRGSYETSALAGWAGAFSSWRRAGKEVYCYFDNDEAAFAARNARQLQAMLGGAA